MEKPAASNSPDKELKPKKPRKMKPVIFVIIALILGLLSGALATYLYFNPQVQQLNESVQRLTNMEESDDSTSGTDDVDEVDDDSEEDSVEADCASSTEGSCGMDLPVVVHVAAGLFTDTEKAQIQSRIVDPLVDYTLESEDRRTVSVTIEKSDLADYDYEVLAIFEDGVNTGFLHGDGSGGEVDWWKPECLGPCTFSAEFSAKYPEVVE